MSGYVDNIENLLTSVLRWLESSDDNEKWWKLQTQVAQLCLQELELLEQSGKDQHQLSGVIPKVRETVDAMRQRNKPAALKAGQKARELLLDLD